MSSKKALLVIDMLNDFISPDGALYIGETAEKVTEEVKKTIEKARENGIPVIYICDSHREDDAEFKMFELHCVKGTTGGEIVDILAPSPGITSYQNEDIVRFGTDLDAYLRELGISELILVGV